MAVRPGTAAVPFPATQPSTVGSTSLTAGSIGAGSLAPAACSGPPALAAPTHTHCRRVSLTLRDHCVRVGYDRTYPKSER
jgi:hypothetical protein